MEMICSSETSVDSQRTTRRCIPEDGTLPPKWLLVFGVSQNPISHITEITVTAVRTSHLTKLKTASDHETKNQIK
jgi:hypothetical protein